MCITTFRVLQRNSCCMPNSLSLTIDGNENTGGLEVLDKNTNATLSVQQRDRII